jgi:S1-C subfamily serine protease
LGRRTPTPPLRWTQSSTSPAGKGHERSSALRSRFQRDGARTIFATADHVAAFERAFVITRGSSLHRAMTVIIRARDADLALLEIDGNAAPPLPLAEPAEGATGIVIGHPYDRAWTTAASQVLGPHLVEDYEARSTDLLVTCTRCGPGDSGGAVVDAGGSLIGIAIAAFSSTTYAVRSCVIGALLRAARRHMDTAAVKTACSKSIRTID